MVRGRGRVASRVALALALSWAVAGGSARAGGPRGQLLASAEPLVWVDNCPVASLRPRALRCLSRRLVSTSHAQGRGTPSTPAPDAGDGVDASSEIETCNGLTNTGSGGMASGLGPTDFKDAYAIPPLPTGAGKIVAIVDACANPTVVSDLATYRANYGLGALPECDGGAGHAPVAGGAACIGVMSERGGGDLPPPDSSWALEIALDVEMVSAVCPDCSILLVEADTPNTWDVAPAVDEAVALGASAVSNSYGATEDPNDPFGPAYSDGPYATDYQHPGVLITVASGDDLYDDESTGGAAPSFPASVASVLSVGGTTLAADSGTPRGYTEVVWSSSGSGTTSGCSTEFAMPGYQSGLDAGSCHARADVDVAAAGENVAVYQGGWQRVSGTSCASPLVAALFTRIGLESQANAFFYAHGSAFYDITSGNNDPDDRCNDVMCNAGVGWDGPTGWGTPNGAALLLALDADSGGAEADGGVKAGHDAPEAGEEDATTNDASEGTDATQGTVPEAGGAVEEGGDGTTAGSNGCGCVAAGAASSPQAPGGLLLLAVWLARRERSRARRG